MSKKSLILSFVLSFMFLSSAALAQNEWFSNWLNTDILSNIQASTPATPDSLVSFLQNFGISRDISVNWGGILYFIIIPLLTFAIILKAILVDEIVVRGMGLGAFQHWKGWVFVLLLLAFLFPTGLVGMTAMWLYGSAGILMIYGFGALLVIAVINRLIGRVTGKWYFGTVISVFIAILVAILIPGAGILIAILAIFMTLLGGYRKFKRLDVFTSDLSQSKRNAEDLRERGREMITSYDLRAPDKHYFHVKLHDQYLRALKEGLTNKEKEDFLKNLNNDLKEISKETTKGKI